jgi:hypothetical protein
MKYINTIAVFRRLFFTEEKKVLGRWSIEQCDKKLNAKIDLSNEDHCGPCGQYILNKTNNSIVIYKASVKLNGPAKNIHNPVIPSDVITK